MLMNCGFDMIDATYIEDINHMGLKKVSIKPYIFIVFNL